MVSFVCGRGQEIGWGYSIKRPGMKSCRSSQRLSFCDVDGRWPSGIFLREGNLWKTCLVNSRSPTQGFYRYHSSTAGFSGLTRPFWFKFHPTHLKRSAILRRLPRLQNRHLVRICCEEEYVCFTDRFFGLYSQFAANSACWLPRIFFDPKILRFTCSWSWLNSPKQFLVHTQVGCLMVVHQPHCQAPLHRLPGCFRDPLLSASRFYICISSLSLSLSVFSMKYMSVSALVPFNSWTKLSAIQPLKWRYQHA